MINLVNQNKAIYKTRNTGTGKGMRETRRMFSTIPGNLLEDSGECNYFNIPRMLKKIPGNVSKFSRKRWRRFREMLVEILKKIGRFIMQLNKNRIKGYILKYNKKCPQKLIKTSHMNKQV